MLCTKCGAQIDEKTGVCGNCGETVHYVNNEAMVHGRGIGMAILFTILSCGIYGIYWMIKINDSVNILAENQKYTTGGMVFLLSLVTCGIYALFWMYKMGENCDKIKGQDGNSGILYLVLALFGFGIVSYCLMQDTVNKRVGYGN